MGGTVKIGRFVAFLIVGAMLTLGALVWPTRYRYEHVEHPRNGAAVLVRIDRLNGQTEYLTREGWSTYLPKYAN